MAKRYIFFDVSGTLLARQGLYDAIADALGGHGYRLEPQKIRRAHKKISAKPFPDNPGNDFYRIFNTNLCRELGVKADAALVDEIISVARALPRMPYPDTDVLKTLPQPLGIISNWGTDLEAALTHYFPGVRFAPVVYSKKEGIAKPDIRLYRRAIERAAIDASACVYVGDSPALDMEPARKAGFRTILIDRDNDHPGFRGRKIRSLKELVRMFGT